MDEEFVGCQEQARIERVGKYSIQINGHTVYANDDQERRIRNLTGEQLQNFLRIMGKD